MKYEPVLNSICLMYCGDRKPTGEGYIVAFAKPDYAKKVMMTLDHKYMKDRYIELFISDKDEHGRAHRSNIMDSDKICLNVGGTEMYATRETLTKIKESRLEALFNGR